MGFKEFLAKRFGKDEDFQAAKKELRIQKLLAQREKGSDERELERFMEEDRQARIKQALVKFRQREKEKMKENIFKTNNIFKGHQNILEDNKKLFSMKAGKGSNLYFK